MNKPTLAVLVVSMHTRSENSHILFLGYLRLIRIVRLPLKEPTINIIVV